MSGTFAYWAELTLEDGSLVKVDLEEHGWAEPERLALTRVFTLVPKIVQSGGYPFIRVHIPTGAKPVFKSRPVKNLKPFGVELFRAYAVGWFKDGVSHWTWAMPNGSIEQETDEPTFVDLISKAMTDALFAQLKAKEEAEKAQAESVQEEA